MIGALAVLIAYPIRHAEFAASNLPLRSDPTVELKDWDELRTARAQRPVRSRNAGRRGSHWMDAAKVAYALGPGVPVICVCRVPQHFSFLRDPADFAGRDIIVVGNRLSDRRLQWLDGHFKQLEPLEPVPLYRAGAVVKTLVLYKGTDFDASGARLRKGAADRRRSTQRPISRSNSDPGAACQLSGGRGEEQGCWPD